LVHPKVIKGEHIDSVGREFRTLVVEWSVNQQTIEGEEVTNL
jgi:hypothetical protein